MKAFMLFTLNKHNNNMISIAMAYDAALNGRVLCKGMENRTENQTKIIMRRRVIKFLLKETTGFKFPLEKNRRITNDESYTEALKQPEGQTIKTQCGRLQVVSSSNVRRQSPGLFHLLKKNKVKSTS